VSAATGGDRAVRRGPPRRPTLYVARDGARHATWLELFFDLVFVLAIAELAHLLHDDPTPGGFLRFAVLFVPVWWAWSGFTYYADLFDVDGPIYRVAILVAMFGSIALALNVHDAFDGESFDFAATYAALRALLVGLYAWAWRHAGVARRICSQHIVGYGLGAVLWAASLLVPEPSRYALWGVALLIELATPVVIQYGLTHGQPQDSHLPERYGLFTLVVLGESVVVTGTGLADADWAAGAIVVAAAGFTAVGCLWWLYFDQVDEAMLERPYPGRRRGLLIGFGWAYGHLGIFATLAATAVGVQLAIEEAARADLTGGARAALGGGIACSLAVITALRALSPPPPEARVVAARLAAAAAVLALAAAGAALAPPVLATLVTTTLVALTAFESTLGDRLGDRVEAAAASDSGE